MSTHRLVVIVIVSTPEGWLALGYLGPHLLSRQGATPEEAEAALMEYIDKIVG
jgi:hypothetical protein